MLRSPWPMKLGSPLNDGVATATLAGTGHLAWKAPLPERRAHDVVTDGEGRTFVAGDRWLTAVVTGRTAWTLTTDTVFSDLVVMPDGGLLVAEVGRRLLALDPGTGALRWAVQGDWTSGRPIVTSDGGIAHSRNHADQRVLTLLEGDHAQRWSIPYDSIDEVLAFEDVLLLPMDRSLDAVDLEGRRLWRATPRGFFEP